jgi:hypothetical protein
MQPVIFGPSRLWMKAQMLGDQPLADAADSIFAATVAALVTGYNEVPGEQKSYTEAAARQSKANMKTAGALTIVIKLGMALPRRR